MQIKTTMRYDFTPVRITIINKSTNKKYWLGSGEKGSLMHCCGNADRSATVESSTELPQKIKIWTSSWHSDPTSGDISKEIWNTNSKEYMHPCVYCRVIYNSQDLETTQMSINWWVDKRAVIHLHNGTLFSYKKEEILPSVIAWMDMENIMPSKLNQSEKDRYHMISLIHGI